MQHICYSSSPTVPCQGEMCSCHSWPPPGAQMRCPPNSPGTVLPSLFSLAHSFSFFSTNIFSSGSKHVQSLQSEKYPVLGPMFLSNFSLQFSFLSSCTARLLERMIYAGCLHCLPAHSVLHHPLQSGVGSHHQMPRQKSFKTAILQVQLVLFPLV